MPKEEIKERLTNSTPFDMLLQARGISFDYRKRGKKYIGSIRENDVSLQKSFILSSNVLFQSSLFPSPTIKEKFVEGKINTIEITIYSFTSVLLMSLGITYAIAFPHTIFFYMLSVIYASIMILFYLIKKSIINEFKILLQLEL